MRRQLVLVGVMAFALTGCPGHKGGGGGGTPKVTIDNSNPITRQEEDTGAAALRAQPEQGVSGNYVTGRQTESIESPTVTVASNNGQPAFKVDVNTANQQELMRVPGMSASLAQSIIRHRPYSSKEDLLRRVPNLNHRLLSSFEQYLTFGPSKHKS